MQSMDLKQISPRLAWSPAHLLFCSWQGNLLKADLGVFVCRKEHVSRHEFQAAHGKR